MTINKCIGTNVEQCDFRVVFRVAEQSQVARMVHETQCCTDLTISKTVESQVCLKHERNIADVGWKLY